MHYVVVGHPCQDVAPHGYVWGGGVIYSGLTAHQLGASVSVITRCQPHTELDPRLHWYITPDTQTTIFENRYDTATGNRHQLMHARAGDIWLTDTSQLATPPDIIHLAPVANEVRYDTLPTLSDATWLVATPQGWMRRRAADNRVEYTVWQNADQLLPHLKVLSLSEEDVNGDIDLVRHYATIVPYVLYTRGYNGAVLYIGNRTLRVDALPSTVLDLTGAGDVIAAAFFVRLRETNDPQEALSFGAAAAAIAIEHLGATGIPTHQQIAERRRLTLP